jgi:F-type H+-transporting ATPase subunit delta
MAEIATLARPYAEALFQVAVKGDLKALGEQVRALGVVTANEQLRQFADNPKTTAQQVLNVVQAALTEKAGLPLSAPIINLVRTVIDNGRLSVVPEMAAQFQALVNQHAGSSDAVVYSAFPIGDAQLTDLVQTLEKRFGRKLNATVQVEPELIGGVRVVVGDEVLDTSVKARLEQMKVALTA